MANINDKIFYTNIFSGSYLTQDEFEFWVKDFDSDYSLIESISSTGIVGVKVVFNDNYKLEKILS